MQTAALSLSLISVLHRKTTGEAVCSRDRDNEVFSCKFYRVDSFINIIFFFFCLSSVGFAVQPATLLKKGTYTNQVVSDTVIGKLLLKL